MRFSLSIINKNSLKPYAPSDTVFSRLRDDFFYVASWTSNILSMVDSPIGWNPVSLELSMYY